MLRAATWLLLGIGAVVGVAGYRPMVDPVARRAPLRGRVYSPRAGLLVGAALSGFCAVIAWLNPALALRRTLAVLLVALPWSAHGALGICRQEAARSDGYMQLLCQGEAALAGKEPQSAVKHFSEAAALQRFSASNELAWAGLAAAHCSAGEAQTGREWAQRFDAARRIWSGETPCALDNGSPNPKIPQQVHRQLCTEVFAPDYAMVHAQPQSAIAQDIRARLDGVHRAVSSACGTTAQPKPAGSASQKPAAKTKKKTRSSGRTVSPAPGK